MKVLFTLVAVILAASQPFAEASCVDIVPIEEWGGSPSEHKVELKTPVDLVIVTHTITGECNNDHECRRMANIIRRVHKERGFDDIGLSYLIGGHGQIYEGAGRKAGRHTQGYNDKAITLSFIGDFEDKIPSTAALKAAERFLGCHLNTAFLDCEYKLVGHRQLVDTTSPGDALQEHIQSWPHWARNVQTRPY